MFNKAKAFSGYSVDNIEKAKDFYSHTLGLTVKLNSMGILELHIEGSSPVILYPKDNHVPATFTVLNFPVNDIKEAVHQLMEKGVVFEQYGGDIQTDENGICWSDKGPNLAWFKDPSGNILSVIED